MGFQLSRAGKFWILGLLMVFALPLAFGAAGVDGAAAQYTGLAGLLLVSVAGLWLTLRGLNKNARRQ